MELGSFFVAMGGVQRAVAEQWGDTMGDPTFAQQFSMATQADILQQAERDRLCAQERSACDARRTGRSAHGLIGLLRKYLRGAASPPLRVEPRED